MVLLHALPPLSILMVKYTLRFFHNKLQVCQRKGRGGGGTEYSSTGVYTLLVGINKYANTQTKSTFVYNLYYEGSMHCEELWNVWVETVFKRLVQKSPL